MTNEEIKNEFINCIEGSHTLNLAISILEDREELQQRIDEAIEYIKKHRQIYDIDGSKEPKLDEFHILASPRTLIKILEGDVK